MSASAVSGSFLTASSAASHLHFSSRVRSVLCDPHFCREKNEATGRSDTLPEVTQLVSDGVMV